MEATEPVVLIPEALAIKPSARTLHEPLAGSLTVLGAVEEL